VTRRDVVKRLIEESAVHEAGHAVFMWRSQYELFAVAHAGFREIVLGSYLAWMHDKPLVLSYGGVRAGLGGVVVRPSVIYIPGTLAAVRRQLRLDPRLRALGGHQQAFADAAAALQRGEPPPSTVEEILQYPHAIGETRAELRARAKWCRTTAEHVVISCLAGPMAQAKHKGEDFDFWVEYEEETCFGEDPGHDLVKAYVIAKDVTRGRRSAATYINRVQEKVAEKLSDPAVWRTITALAGTLIKRRRLSGDQALRVMRRAWDAA